VSYTLQQRCRRACCSREKYVPTASGKESCVPMQRKIEIYEKKKTQRNIATNKYTLLLLASHQALNASAPVFHAPSCIRRQDSKVRFCAICWKQGTGIKMGDCVFLPAEAAGISIIFITPFDQIGFPEAHRSSQAI